jgi:hypothetical protein
MTTNLLLQCKPQVGKVDKISIAAGEVPATALSC